MVEHRFVAGWGDMNLNLDLRGSKLVVPPRELLAALQSLPHTADFATVPGSVRAA